MAKNELSATLSARMEQEKTVEPIKIFLAQMIRQFVGLNKINILRFGDPILQKTLIALCIAHIIIAIPIKPSFFLLFTTMTLSAATCTSSSSPGLPAPSAERLI